MHPKSLARSWRATFSIAIATSLSAQAGPLEEVIKGMAAQAAQQAAKGGGNPSAPSLPSGGSLPGAPGRAEGDPSLSKPVMQTEGVNAGRSQPMRCGHFSSTRMALPDLGQKPAGLPDEYWPTNRCAVYNFNDYDFPRDEQRKKLAFLEARRFREASRYVYRCREGIRCSQDTVGHSIFAADLNPREMGTYREWEAKLGTLPDATRLHFDRADHTVDIAWQGNYEIGGTRCRVYHWTLTRKPSELAAEKDQMVCFYQYANNPGPLWHLVDTESS